MRLLIRFYFATLVLIIFSSFVLFVGLVHSYSQTTPTATTETKRLPHEAIVVLGEKLHSDQMPRVGMKRRVHHAVSLWKTRRNSAMLVLSGSKKPDAGFGESYMSEAQAMYELAACEGVPESSMRLEQRATNTAQNAAYVARLLSNLSNVDTVTVVSSDWHLPRASTVFLLAFSHFGSFQVFFDGAPDPGPNKGLASDLRMMGSTINDLQALYSGFDKSYLVWSLAVQALENLDAVLNRKDDVFLADSRFNISFENFW